MKFSTDAFQSWLYEHCKPAENLLDCDASRIPTLLAEKRKNLAGCLGLDRLKAFEQHQPPTFDWSEQTVMDGYIQRLGEHTSLPHLVMPLYRLEPVDPFNSTPAVIYCHGHGDGATEVVDPACSSLYQKTLPISLAKHGYRVFVPELFGFGKVVMEGFKEKEQAGCYANSTRLLMHGLTTAGVRVLQTLQIIKYLNDSGSEPFLAGISGGGLVASFAAALAEHYGLRIKGAFISGYTNTFLGSSMAMHHCIDNFIPDILSYMEEPELIALATPIPLLISSGTDDPIFPIEHTRAAIDEIKAIYDRFGCKARIEVELFDSGHEISENAIYGWLKRYDC